MATRDGVKGSEGLLGPLAGVYGAIYEGPRFPREEPDLTPRASGRDWPKDLSVFIPILIVYNRDLIM
jgi:hypothetical protein